MKIMSWNVNGVGTCLEELRLFLLEHEPDILCLQETKAIDAKVENWLQEFEACYPYQSRLDAKMKGYSGMICLSKVPPLDYQEGFRVDDLDQEGRLQVLTYSDFSLLNVYLPSIHSRSSLKRQNYRMMFDDALLDKIESLQASGVVLVCGDLNAACSKEDMSNNHQRYGGLDSGFMREDDQTLTGLMELGLVDSFRWKYPDKNDAYTWWSNKNGKREKNQGCRLDYILLSKELATYIKAANIYTKVAGSDHCPIGVELAL